MMLQAPFKPVNPLENQVGAILAKTVDSVVAFKWDQMILACQVIFFLAKIFV
jgi:hypothetical protein